MNKRESLFAVLCEQGFEVKWSYELIKGGTSIKVCTEDLYYAECQDTADAELIQKTFDNSKKIPEGVLIFVFVEKKFKMALSKSDSMRVITNHLGKKMKLYLEQGVFKAGKIGMYLKQENEQLVIRNANDMVFERISIDDYKQKIKELSFSVKLVDVFLLNLQRRLAPTAVFEFSKKSLVINDEYYYLIIKVNKNLKYDLTFYRVYEDLNKLESVELNVILSFIEKKSMIYDKNEKIACFFR